MKISKYFTLKEATQSETATRKGIKNIPNKDVMEKLIYFAVNTADKIRELFGKPIKPSSWFRCIELNTAIGGSKTSDHIFAEAFDFRVAGYTIKQIVIKIASCGLIDFDQIIIEYDAWCHVSCRRDLKNRKQIIRIFNRDGKKVKQYFKLEKGELIKIKEI